MCTAPSKLRSVWGEFKEKFLLAIGVIVWEAVYSGLDGGVSLGQSPRLAIDIIEEVSFKLIKWVTVSGCRIEDIDPLWRKNKQAEKGQT